MVMNKSRSNKFEPTEEMLRPVGANSFAQIAKRKLARQSCLHRTAYNLFAN